MLAVLLNVVYIIGSICYFFNPVITVICAIISVIESITNFLRGAQNSLITEIFTLVIGFILALVFNQNIFLFLCFSLCAGAAITFVLGTIIFFILNKMY